MEIRISARTARIIEAISSDIGPATAGVFNFAERLLIIGAVAYAAENTKSFAHVCLYLLQGLLCTMFVWWTHQRLFRFVHRFTPGDDDLSKRPVLFFISLAVVGAFAIWASLAMGDLVRYLAASIAEATNSGGSRPAAPPAPKT